MSSTLADRSRLRLQHDKAVVLALLGLGISGNMILSDSYTHDLAALEPQLELFGYGCIPSTAMALGMHYKVGMLYDVDDRPHIPSFNMVTSQAMIISKWLREQQL